MDDRPTPRVDSLVNAKNTYSSLGEVLSWYEDAVHLARQLERSNAELVGALREASRMTNYAATGFTPGFTQAEWMTRNAQQILEHINTALRNAGVSHE